MSAPTGAVDLALQGLLKALESAVEAWEDHKAELRAARAETHAAAQQDLDAVDGRPVAPTPTEQDAQRSWDADLP